MKKYEYAIKERNQPSDKASRRFHEHVAEIDIPLPKVHHSTQDKQKT